MVTEEDICMIEYFLKEKGDITRWIDWADRKDDIARAFPELIVAMHNLTVAERTLDAVVNNLHVRSL